MSKYLIGATEDNELVFCEFGINPYGNYFSASFDVVVPFDEMDPRIRFAAEDYIAAVDSDTRWDMLITYDCTPSELADRLIEDEGIASMMDCSLYPEVISAHGVDYYFESLAGGQCDPREYEIVEWACDKQIFDNLMNLWDNYHLKEYENEDYVEALKSGMMEGSSNECIDWIAAWIERSNI